MKELTITIPNDISFQQAIACTQALLDVIEQGNISESEVERVVQELASSENGARGFFVTYLSDDRTLADQPTPVIIQALQTSPDVVAPLLVKNLAMSTAMAIFHRRNQHEEMAQGSDRVRTRTAKLMPQLRSPQLQTEAHALAVTIETGSGPYQAFLQRWGYDLEQQQAIHQSLKQTGLT